MATHESTTSEVAFLAGFEPMEGLWQGENPLCTSKHSAHWLLRRNREQLVAANALALHRNRMYVHRERLCRVLEERALGDVRRRLASA